MSKPTNSSIYIILKTVKEEQLLKDGVLFNSTKQALFDLATYYTKFPIITERSLNEATKFFLSFCKNHIETHDTAPEHKSRIGYKIYGDMIARLNKITLFKNNNIELFQKVQDSCYITTELAKTHKNFNLGYSHTYALTEQGKTLHNLVMCNLKAIRKNAGVKEILGLSKITKKDIVGKDVIKIAFKDYKKMITIYNSIYIHNNGTKEDYNKIKGISLLLKNVIGCIGNTVYVENTALGKNSEFREYTVYTSISKTLRKIIHPHHMDYDIDNSSISMFLNVLTEIDKQKSNKKYIVYKDKGKTKYRRKSFDSGDWKYRFPALVSYMKHKYATRLQVQNALSHKTIDETKTFLTSLNFGSSIGNLKFNQSSDRKNLIFTKLLIKEEQNLIKYITKSFLDRDEEYLSSLTILGMNGWDLRNQIEESLNRHKILHEKRDNRIKERRKSGENTLSKPQYGRGKKLSSKRLARLYFILEEKVRNKMLDYLDESGIEDSLQIHDCVAFSKMYSNIESTFSTHKMSDYVKEHLGYNLTFSSSEQSNINK